MTDTATVAVVHPKLSKGGSDAVCLNVLEALQSDYDVTLVTDLVPALGELNDFFDTAVHDITVRTPHNIGNALDVGATVVSLVSPTGFDRLRKAVLTRYLSRYQHEFDIIISTKNELSLTARSIQYIHSPKYDRTAVPGLVGNSNPIQPVYDAICNRLAGTDQDKIRNGTMLANSAWTADVVEQIHGITPRVVYPPVNTAGFAPQPWADRETGFVSIGRIAPSKNVTQAIEIVSQLRNVDPDVHLHLVGPAPDGDYHEQIQERVATLDFVHLEGELPRSELVELVSTHRYGLHTRQHEHFGIAVAELVAGGAVPFVPAAGGPREIVGEQSTLLFDSTERAVETISRVLSDPARQRELRDGLPDIETQFGRKRFQETIRSIVATELETDE